MVSKLKIPANIEVHPSCPFTADCKHADVYEAPATIEDEAIDRLTFLSSVYSRHVHIRLVLAPFFSIFQAESLGMSTVVWLSIFLLVEIF